MNETEIERLVVRIVGDMSQYQQTMRDARKETEQSTGSILGTLAKLTAGVIAAGAAIASAFAIGGVMKGFGLAKEAEQSNIAFEVMLGSAEKAQTMLKDMRAFGAATPLTTPDIQNAGKTLLQFGVAGENVMPLLRMLGDVTGGNSQRFQQMSLAFGQMAASGRLMGQDLLQMINAGFNPLQEISKKTGRSIGDLKLDMEKGLITQKMVVEAFQAATSAGGTFNGMMEKQSQSIEGLSSTLEDNIGVALMKISNSLMSAFDMKGIIQDAIAWLDIFNANYEANIQILTDWIMDKWTTVKDWTLGTFGDVAEGASEVWTYIQEIVGIWVNNTLGFFNNFRFNVAELWRWLGENWQNLLIDMFNMTVTFIGNSIDNYITYVGMLQRTYATFAGWLVGRMRSLFTYEFLDAVLTGLIAAGQKIRDWASAAWESIKAIFTGKQAPGALDAFIEQAKNDFNKGMADGDLIGSLKKVWDEESGKFKNPLEGFESAITEGPKLKLGTEGMNLLPEFAWKTGDEAKTQFSNAVTGLADPIAKETKKAKRAMKELDAVAYNSAEAFSRVWEYKLNKKGPTLPSMMTGLAGGARAGASAVASAAGGGLANSKSSNVEVLLAQIAGGIAELVKMTKEPITEDPGVADESFIDASGLA